MQIPLDEEHYLPQAYHVNVDRHQGSQASVFNVKVLENVVLGNQASESCPGIVKKADGKDADHVFVPRLAQW